MTKEEFARLLSCGMYGKELTKEEEILAAENGFVVIFGASDDLCELRGAINDEFDCFEGGEIECEELPGKLTAVWCPKDSEASWAYETDLPHAEFRVYDNDNDELYCIGIVIDLNECARRENDYA